MIGISASTDAPGVFSTEAGGGLGGLIAFKQAAVNNLTGARSVVAE